MGRTYDHSWRKVRVRVLERDGGVCQVRGATCTGSATEVDHVVPVDAGGARLDMANLRASCGKCNRRRAARAKHREGWRRARTRIVLVVGPPGAGKSTLVADRAGPGDVVVDYDRLAEALGSDVTHGHGLHADVAAAARGAVLTRLRRGEVDAARAWIVSANPEAEAMFPHHEVLVVDPGEDEAVRRCVDAGRPEQAQQYARDWYRARAGGGGGASREW